VSDATSHIADCVWRPAFSFQVFAIIVQGTGDDQRFAFAGCGASSLNHSLAPDSLCLSKVENCDPVGIAEIICRGYGLDVVGFITDIVPHNPLTRAP
jgi:hypothetical protein